MAERLGITFELSRVVTDYVQPDADALRCEWLGGWPWYRHPSGEGDLPLPLVTTVTTRHEIVVHNAATVSDGDDMIDLQPYFWRLSPAVPTAEMVPYQNLKTQFQIHAPSITHESPTESRSRPCARSIRSNATPRRSM